MHHSFFLISLLSISALVGCGPIDSSTAGIESMVLYSVDGKFKASNDKRTPAGEFYRGRPVFGKVSIDDAATRAKVLSELNKSITASDGTVSKCFWPRHALKVTRRGQKTIEYVICFECLQLKSYENNQSETTPITKSAEAYFDKLLSDAGVKLAPK